ncbi:MAG: hypothetical protein ACI9MR_000217 [Myxococcota bacterium]|jgi:hypothetical protein
MSGRTHWGAAAACLLAMACSDSAGGGTDTALDTIADDTIDVASSTDTGTDILDSMVADSVEETGADTPSDTTPMITEFEALVGRYNLLETVAGLGRERDKSVNGWLSAYEGGAANAAELSRPHMAMGDLAGNIYIADKDAHAVRMVSPLGVITTVAGTSVVGDDGDTAGPASMRRLSSPNGLYVLPSGVFFVLDLGNGKVRRVGTDGTMSTHFTVSTGVSTGRGLWVAADESLAYVASGTQVLRWRSGVGVDTLAGGFSSLGNLDVDPAGRLVVTDRGASQVYRLSATGMRTAIAGNGQETGGNSGEPALSIALLGVRGVFFRPDGSYFLATHAGSQVWFVDTAGIAWRFVDGRDDHSHAGDGQFFQNPGAKISEARAVTVDPAGNVIITENDYGYIRVVRLKE